MKKLRYTTGYSVISILCMTFLFLFVFACSKGGPAAKPDAPMFRGNPERTGSSELEGPTAFAGLLGISNLLPPWSAQRSTSGA